MGLFKHTKSRQEKIPDSEETTTDSVDKHESTDVLSTMADMPITEHLIELRKHLIKICIAVLVIFLR